MMYALIYLKETDGEIQIDYCLSKKEVKEKTDSMHPSDYAILMGDMIKIKSFENENFNVDNLK